MRVERRSLRKPPFIQNLFSSPIDFDNKTVFDSINGYNASLKYSGALKFNSLLFSTNLNNPNLPKLNAPFTISIFQKMKYSSSDRNEYLCSYGVGASRFNGIAVCQSISSISLAVKVNGGGQLAIGTTNNSDVWQTITYNGAGVYTMYKDGGSAVTYTGTTGYIGNWAFYSDGYGVGIGTYYKLLFHNRVLTPQEITSIVNKSTVSDGLVGEYNFSEGSSNKLVCKVTGLVTELTQNYTDALNRDLLNPSLNNMKNGFDLYTLTASPYTRLYIPLKYDGTSFNLVIAGYTFVQTVTQSGSEFLNCETKLVQPNIQDLKSLDTSNFYFNSSGVALEKSFDNLLTAPPYVNYVLSNNKINNLTI